jgi:AraC family transcriptional regulator of adaptative response / DNA-3-methyladenine glycosylase II
MKLVEGVRGIFDLGADTLRIQQDLSRDPRLKRLVERRPGLRVPGVWDGFELAVCAVLGEQLTVRHSTARAGRLVQAFGKPIQTSVQGLSHLFPTPHELVAADLSKAGLDVASAAAVKGLAREVCSGHFALSRSFTNLDDVVSQICNIRGVSATTAHYIAMRALGETDAFPFADPSLRAKFGNGRPSAASDDLLVFAERWRPWRAYAAIHLYTASRSDRPF